MYSSKLCSPHYHKTKYTVWIVFFFVRRTTVPVPFLYIFILRVDWLVNYYLVINLNLFVTFRRSLFENPMLTTNMEVIMSHGNEDAQNSSEIEQFFACRICYDGTYDLLLYVLLLNNSNWQGRWKSIWLVHFQVT